MPRFSKKRTFLILVVGLSLGIVALLGAAWWVLTSWSREDAARWLGEQTGMSIEWSQLHWTDRGRRLEIRDLQVGDFARVDFIEMEWTWQGLVRRREVESLRVLGMNLWLGRMLVATSGGGGGGASPLGPITLKKLVVGQSQLFLDNLGPGMPVIPVNIGAVTPLVLENLVLGADEDDPAAREIMLFVIEDLEFRSPYDHLAPPVLSFEKITLGFSWNGIQAKQIDRVNIERPTIRISQDLFWFVDEVKKNSQQLSAEKAAADELPWTISNLDVVAGSLVLATFDEDLRLPLIFETRKSGLVLDNFADTQIDTQFTIPDTNLNYSEYDLRIEGMSGELLFSLPVEERGSQDLSNINPVLTINKVDFKGISAEKLFITVTFDRKGIYGRVGGRSYDGYVEGDFFIMLDGLMSWQAWGSITGLELQPLTAMLTPDNFVMDGPVDSVFQAKGISKEVLSMNGRLDVTRAGTMHVTAIDTLLEKLPEDMAPLRRQLSEIALEAFRIYNFHGGSVSFDYAPPTSSLNLALEGEEGVRDIGINWHDHRTQTGFKW